MNRVDQKKKSFKAAVNALAAAVAHPVTEDRDLGGIIKAFEIAYELTWKLLKSVLADQGEQTQGPRDVFGKAYRLSYLEDEVVWLEMISDRNATVHTYYKKFAEEMVARIKRRYVPVFVTLIGKMEAW